jgi:hypothetical protein
MGYPARDDTAPGSGIAPEQVPLVDSWWKVVVIDCLS